MSRELSHHQTIRVHCHWVARQRLGLRLNLIRVYGIACLMMSLCGAALTTGHPHPLLCTIQMSSTCTRPRSIQETFRPTCLRHHPPNKPPQAIPHPHLMPSATPAQPTLALGCSSSRIPSIQSSSSRRSHCCQQASLQTGRTTHTQGWHGRLSHPLSPVTLTAFIL